MASFLFRPACAITLIVGVLLLSACDSPTAVPPHNAAPRAHMAPAFNTSLGEGGAFFAGNFSGVGAPGDGVLRYTATGEFVDQFVATDPDRLIIGCCMTFGPDDNLYVVSPIFDKVLRYNGATGEFIDEFVSSEGGLVFPVTIGFGPDGHLYVAQFGPDFAAPSVRRYDGRTGEFLGVFVEPHAGGMAMAPDPQQFAWGPDGHFYLTAPLAGKLLRFDGRTGDLIDTFIANEPGRPPVGASLAFGTDGLLYLAGDYAVSRYDAVSGAFIDVFVQPNSGGLSLAEGILFGPDGHLYVANSVGGNVLRFDGRTGAFIDEFIPAGRGGINGPRMIAFKMKTKVCHRPPGKNRAARLISVGQLDAAAHVRHGDAVGGC